MQISSPKIEVFNRQRKVKFDLPALRIFARVAVEECMEHSHGQHPLLAQLPQVEVSILSDAAIASVHGQFLEDPTPTDVITFAHGEILVSAQTALANARQYGARLQEELGLYIIHGFLHLNGFLDETPAEAALMHRVQARLLAASLARMNQPPAKSTKSTKSTKPAKS